jgi:hypothetical protein
MLSILGFGWSKQNAKTGCEFCNVRVVKLVTQQKHNIKELEKVIANLLQTKNLDDARTKSIPYINAVLYLMRVFLFFFFSG